MKGSSSFHHTKHIYDAFRPTCRLILVLHHCLPLVTVFAQLTSPNSPVLTPEIDAFINGLLSDWKSPGGLSVAVVRKTGNDSWNVETKGYGLAKSDGTKVTERTLFSIGSNSKVHL